MINKLNKEIFDLINCGTHDTPTAEHFNRRLLDIAKRFGLEVTAERYNYVKKNLPFKDQKKLIKLEEVNNE